MEILVVNTNVKFKKKKKRKQSVKILFLRRVGFELFNPKQQQKKSGLHNLSSQIW